MEAHFKDAFKPIIVLKAESFMPNGLVKNLGRMNFYFEKINFTDIGLLPSEGPFNFYGRLFSKNYPKRDKDFTLMLKTSPTERPSESNIFICYPPLGNYGNYILEPFSGIENNFTLLMQNKTAQGKYQSERVYKPFYPEDFIIFSYKRGVGYYIYCDGQKNLVEGISHYKVHEGLYFGTSENKIPKFDYLEFRVYDYDMSVEQINAAIQEMNE